MGRGSIRRATAMVAAMVGLVASGTAAGAAERAPAGAADVAEPAVDLVRPFAGTAGGGNTFPGPALPFGMVQLSPDTGYWGGYRWEDSTIEGFSHTKLSGGGCGGAGDVPFMPTTGAIATDPGAYRSAFSHEKEQAELGYYAVDLDRYGVHAELSATTRTGWHAYTFPETAEANVLVDVGNAVGAVYDSSVLADAPFRAAGSAARA